MKRWTNSLCQTVTLGLLISFTANGQWSSDPNVNNPVCVASGSQERPTICTNGAGGAIVAWQDIRSGAIPYHIYAQMISDLGLPHWTTDGVMIASGVRPGICIDGNGGAIILWEDFRDGNNNIYAQRIDGSGTIQWAADGIAICTAANNPDQYHIVSDGVGGAIIVWQDFRGGPNGDIYAQRIDGSGTLQWSVDGVPICTTVDRQSRPQLCSDGAAGAIITWEDYRAPLDSDIYAQRVDGSGIVQWGLDGISICTAIVSQVNPHIAEDNAEGAIITWSDSRATTTWDIYAQRVSSTGAVQWTADGAAVCIAPDVQDHPKVAPDGVGGAFIVWDDFRSNLAEDIYAQWINGSGEIQWGGDGLSICK